MIRRALLGDLERIMTIKKQAVEVMKQDGNDQWDENYPPRERFEADITNGDLYVCEIDKQVVGVICITPIEDEEYKKIPWSVEGKQLIIHRLAVAANNHGSGIAKQLIDYAINLAKQNDVKVIKCDTYSMNPRARKLFLDKGFSFVSNIHFDRRELPYYCFEKIVTTDY